MFWIDSHTPTRNHKNSPLVQWHTHFTLNDFSKDEGGVSRRSAQVVHELLWEASHSEGLTGCCPLRTRMAQRAFLGTTVCRVSGWLTLGNSNFPFWWQSAWCRQQLYNSSSTQNVQFSKQVWLQASGVPGAVRERLIGPTHYSCTKTRKVPSHPNSMHTS